jgi:DNA-binding response OmpR family regulator
MKVLIVEDEPAISMLIEDMISDIGHTVTGCAASCEQARGSITPDIDIVLLDVNLSGEESYPFAEELDKQNVPFVFLTGYGAAGLAPRWVAKPVIQKPFTIEQLRSVLERLISTSPAAKA